MAVHADVFARLVASTSRLAGIPSLRNTFVPTPVPGRTSAELRAYIEGQDPISGRPFIDELLEGLTAPLTEDDMKGARFERTRPRLVDPGYEDELQELFLENGWTDQLPVILPTEQRVEAMLKGTSHGPEEPVGKIRATSTRDFWEFTVEQAAVNAVMAGAKPEYFPVILALLTSGVTARHSSISSIGEMVMINGPIRNEIGMNAGLGALGPYNHANATIGRAYGLGSQNLQGGSIPAISYMGTHGNPLSYVNMTFAENEELSPWEPYHVQRGFSPDQSTATIFTGARTLLRSGTGGSFEEHAATALGSLRGGFGVFLLLDPLAAEFLVADHAFGRKQDLIDWIADSARTPARVWWDQKLQDLFFGNPGRQGTDPWASYLKASPADMIPANRMEDIHVGVVGGRTNSSWIAVEGQPSGTGTNAHIVSVDRWR
ncbi:MAG: UGSC family (seleno)protein [Acidimicrobiales bacterium]